MAMVKNVLYLTKQQVEGLRKISKQTRLPISLLIRDGVDLILKRYKKYTK